MPAYRKRGSKRKRGAGRPAPRAVRRKVARFRRRARIGYDPFPKTMLSRHAYVSRQNIQQQVPNVLTYHLFSCNGMYDPDITGTGHQPMFFDQMSSMYNHYEVLGARITIDFQVVGTLPTDHSNIIVGVHVNDDTVIHGNNFNALVENGNVAWKTLSFYKTTARLVYKWSQKKAFGAKARGNAELKGTLVANPTEQQTFAVFINIADGALSPSAVVNTTVRIDYFAKWTERKDCAQS